MWEPQICKKIAQANQAIKVRAPNKLNPIIYIYDVSWYVMICQDMSWYVYHKP